MKLLIEFDDCRGCPYYKKEVKFGFPSGYICTHPDNNQGAFNDMIHNMHETFKYTPNWCPILESEDEAE